MKKLIFEEPKSYIEAGDRLVELYDKRDAIKLELQNPNKRHKDTGERLNGLKYNEWKFRAQTALSATESEIRYLETWRIKRLDEMAVNTSEENFGIDMNDPVQLLRGAYQILNDMELDSFSNNEAMFIVGIGAKLKEFSVNG